MARGRRPVGREPVRRMPRRRRTPARLGLSQPPADVVLAQLTASPMDPDRSAGRSIRVTKSRTTGWQKDALLTGVVLTTAVIAALYWAQIVFVPVALSVLLVFVLTPPVRW